MGPAAVDAVQGFGALNYAVLAVYLIMCVGVGVVAAGRQSSASEYFLASRNMPWLAVGMSIFASVTSAVSYMGFPGTVVREDLSVLVGYFTSPLAAVVILFLFYPLYHRLNVTTSYEYVFRRYGPNARYAVSALFLLARTGWLGVVIYAPSLALSEAAGLNLYLCILGIGLLSTLYTVMGGLRAVILTDALQFVVLVAGTLWIAVHLHLHLPGGASGILGTALERGHLVQWRFSWFEAGAAALALSYFLGFTQDYGTDQVTVQRLLASRGFGGTVRSILFNSVFDVLFFSLLAFIGLGLFVHFHLHPAEGLSPDRMLPRYIMYAMPPGVSGLLVSGIFAAAMSSLDSGILSVSTVIINDYVRPLGNRPLSESGSILLGRALTVGVGLFATGVAFYVSNIQQILKASNTFLGLFNGPVLALFVLGVLTRRAHFAGWLCGAAAGIAATLCAMNLSFGGSTVHWAFFMPCSFATTALVGYLASWLIPGTPADRQFTLWRGGRAADATILQEEPHT
jgi:SSS family transporter